MWHTDLLCLVTWFLKYFPVNCHQLSIIKLPIEATASVFLLSLPSGDPGVLASVAAAHGVVTSDLATQRAPSAPGAPSSPQGLLRGLVRCVSPAVTTAVTLVCVVSP